MTDVDGRPWPEWLREWLRAAKGMGAEVDLTDWRAAELRRLGTTVAGRLARGAVVRARIGGAAGYVLAERRVRLLHPRSIRAGRGLSLEEGCEIVGLSRQGITFGNRCTVGRFVTIRPSNVLLGPVGEGMTMGDNSNIGAYGYVGCSGFIRIGAGVLMGPNVSLLGENHIFEDAARPIRDQGVRREGIVIGDDCWLGAGSVILDGTTIGAGSVVAAGAVVSRDVAPGSVVGGVPARVIRERGRRADGEG